MTKSNTLLFSTMVAEGLIHKVGATTKGEPLYQLTAPFLKILGNCLIKLVLEYPTNEAEDVLNGAIVLAVIRISGAGKGITEEGIRKRANIAKRILQIQMESTK